MGIGNLSISPRGYVDIKKQWYKLLRKW